MPEKIEIFFLGTTAGIPSPERGQAAVLMRYGGDTFLFDCGENAQVQMERCGVSPLKIKSIFISHWHADHFAGLLPLIETLHMMKRTEPLEIYGPEAERFVDALMELSYWGVGFKLTAKGCGEKEIEKIVDSSRYEIFAIKTKHNVPSCGYGLKEKDHWKINPRLAKRHGLSNKQMGEIKKEGKIRIGNRTIKLEDVAYLRKGRKVVYSGDTLIQKSLFEFSKDADLLIHDSTFAVPMEKRYHSSSAEVAKMAKKYKINKLILTHISRRNPKDSEILKPAKKYFKNCTVAKDLMRVVLE
ncbi:MAG TPA: ribonuclease Z [archaeon]|nr:ribonuclease Z [archaeon]